MRETNPNSAKTTVLQMVPEASGGICRHVAMLCEDLANTGWATGILAPASTVRRVEEFGLPPTVGRVSLDGGGSGPGAIARAALALRGSTTQALLIHAHGYRCAVSAALAGRRPFVVTAHNLIPRPGWLVPGWALRRADAVMVVSEAVATGVLACGVRPERVALAPNGIDLAPLPDSAVRAASRAAILALCPQADAGQRCDELVLGIGRLSPEKGFDVLLHAFELLRRQRPQARLVLLGDGPMREELARQAIALSGSVQLAGEVKDARSLMAGADMVVIPSLQEGQSRVALEALSAGVRVVASDSGGLPSMIRPGATGWLVPPGDAIALAAAMQAALSTQIDAYAGPGRSLIEKDFGRARCFGQVIEIYQNVLQRRRLVNSKS